MKVKIEIDYRESKIIQQLEQLQQLNSLTINFTTLNLPIGDFVIKNEMDDILFIIERKTIADLSSSIKDGRFREQKQRLLDSTNDASKIIYIIEGISSNYKYLLPQNTIDSAIQNLIFKHHYTIIFTKNIQHTVENILLFCKKLEQDEFGKDIKKEPVKLIKKCEAKENAILFNQLCMIPSISNTISQKIIDSLNIKCIADLIKLLTSEEECCILLKDIQITEKRKLGRNTSIRIYKSLFK